MCDETAEVSESVCEDSVSVEETTDVETPDIIEESVDIESTDIVEEPVDTETADIVEEPEEIVSSDVVDDSVQEETTDIIEESTDTEITDVIDESEDTELIDVVKETEHAETTDGIEQANTDDSETTRAEETEETDDIFIQDATAEETETLEEYVVVKETEASSDAINSGDTEETIKIEEMPEEVLGDLNNDTVCATTSEDEVEIVEETNETGIEGVQEGSPELFAEETVAETDQTNGEMSERADVSEITETDDDLDQTQIESTNAQEVSDNTVFNEEQHNDSSVTGESVPEPLDSEVNRETVSLDTDAHNSDGATDVRQVHKIGPFKKAALGAAVTYIAAKDRVESNALKEGYLTSRGYLLKYAGKGGAFLGGKILSSNTGPMPREVTDTANQTVDTLSRAYDIKYAAQHPDRVIQRPQPTPIPQDLIERNTLVGDDIENITGPQSDVWSLTINRTDNPQFEVDASNSVVQDTALETQESSSDKISSERVAEVKARIEKERAEREANPSGFKAFEAGDKSYQNRSECKLSSKNFDRLMKIRGLDEVVESNGKTAAQNIKESIEGPMVLKHGYAGDRYQMIYDDQTKPGNIITSDTGVREQMAEERIDTYSVPPDMRAEHVRHVQLAKDQFVFGGQATAKPESSEVVGDGLSRQGGGQLIYTEGGYESGAIKDAYRTIDEIQNKMTPAQREIYNNSNTEKAVVGGREALVRTDIDPYAVDKKGLTNIERMERGRPPIDSQGKPIELHHMGQDMDSPLAELTKDEHRGKGVDAIMHDKNVKTDINRRYFNTEKKNYWMARAQYYKGLSA